MIAYEKLCLKDRPDWIVVVGDVNPTAACSIVGTKLWIPVIHLEAGLRSGDRSMPEEINRLVTDAIADVLWTPSEDADENLLAEGVDGDKIDRIGNIMIDSLEFCLPAAMKSNILDRLNQNNLPDSIDLLKENNYALVTLHRPGNVDVVTTFNDILSALVRVSSDIPIVFPMHPRTRKLLEKLDQELHNQISKSRLLIIEPVGYLDFLNLQSKSRLVLTDSGGVQVETSYLGIPCLTVRPNTEWQITIREGTNQLVSTNDDLVQAVKNTLGKDNWQPAKIQFWDGKTAERIVHVLKQIFGLAHFA